MKICSWLILLPIITALPIGKVRETSLDDLLISFINSNYEEIKRKIDQRGHPPTENDIRDHEEPKSTHVTKNWRSSLDELLMSFTETNYEAIKNSKDERTVLFNQLSSNRYNEEQSNPDVSKQWRTKLYDQLISFIVSHYNEFIDDLQKRSLAMLNEAMLHSSNQNDNMQTEGENNLEDMLMSVINSYVSDSTISDSEQIEERSQYTTLPSNRKYELPNKRPETKKKNGEYNGGLSYSNGEGTVSKVITVSSTKPGPNQRANSHNRQLSYRKSKAQTLSPRITSLAPKRNVTPKKTENKLGKVTGNILEGQQLNLPTITSIGVLSFLVITCVLKYCKNYLETGTPSLIGLSERLLSN